MKELSEKTIAIARKFPRKWSIPIRFVDMVEEVGELANALLGKWGEKPPATIRAEVEDSLCDILYDLILLSHEYDIDLRKSYLKMLSELEARLEKGEFN